MLFAEVIGHKELKNKLASGINHGRISHAQLFLGPDGSGHLPLAMAYAQYLLCENPTGNDSCGQCPSCQKASKLVHPDLHFSYPVITKKTGEKPKSTDFITEWRSIVNEKKGYFDIHQWLQHIQAENKQGNISVNECHEIIRKFGLKAYEGKYKILIMWLPEFLREAGNVLLKSIEEPPENTIFLFVASDQDKLLNTILSRVQMTRIPGLKSDEIANALVSKESIEVNNAGEIALLSDGSYIEALKLLQHEQGNFSIFKEWTSLIFEERFSQLTDWIEQFSKAGRENQKNLFLYGLHFFRECLLQMTLGNTNKNKSQQEEHAYITEVMGLADFDKIEKLTNLFNAAHYHIERNANPKILFMHVSLKVKDIIKNKITADSLSEFAENI